MKELPIRKRLVLANVCYAYVCGRFADFCDEKNRGPNFKWDDFADICAELSCSYALNIAVKESETSQYDYWARIFSREIAKTLLKRSGFLDK